MLDRVAGAIRTVLERLLLVWLVLLAWIAYCWTDWFGSPPDPFVASKPYLNYVFAVTMLAIGSLLPRDEVRQLLVSKRTVLGGTAVQFLSMPLLAYGIARLFGLEGPWLVGMVMVGCVPGAMASNVLTLAARGNVSYSVSLTASATILSPLVVPWALWLFLRREVDFPTRDVAWKLCWMVVLPVLIGHGLAICSSAWATAARRVGAIIANLTILWIIAVVVADNRGQILQTDPQIILALLVVNLGGYAAGILGSIVLRLPGPKRRALTMEIGMQNAGLGTLLVTTVTDDPIARIAPALYTFGCMLTGTIPARAWAEWDRRRE